MSAERQKRVERLRDRIGTDATGGFSYDHAATQAAAELMVRLGEALEMQTAGCAPDCDVPRCVEARFALAALQEFEK